MTAKLFKLITGAIISKNSIPLSQHFNFSKSNRYIPAFFFFLYYIFFSFLSAQQKTIPTNYFNSPLDTALVLAGNFGEIRPNHFHAGLDIRTNNKEGRKILAVADGYVSRIRVSGSGYGKILYITHPNGFVSTYAHLKGFIDKIESYVKEEHYKREEFEIDISIHPSLFPVKKGEQVAWSGNTGSSSGPHLHFEMRDEKTEVAINPLLFGFNIPDTIPPVIEQLYLYHFPDSLFQESVCDPNTLPVKYPVTGKKGEYSLKNSAAILLFPNAGFGIDAFDRQNGAMNKNGVYSIELKIDGERIWLQVMDSIAFDETRYINSHVDYYEQRAKTRNIQKSFLARNNNLRIYREVKNNGIVNFNDTLTHIAEYLVSDIRGNTSILRFHVKNNPAPDSKLPISCVAIYNCKMPNSFRRDDIVIEFPENSFYEDLKFDYKKTNDTLKGAFTPVHKVHNKFVPVHSYYSLSIRAENVPEKIREKALIVMVNGKNGKESHGGEWKEGFVTTELRTFGDFSVFIDTIPPGIKPINIKANKYMGAEENVRFTVWDNLSGVKSYRCTIDGKWVLMEFDAKKALLFYTFDEKVSAGIHKLKLELVDHKNNKRVYEVGFVR